MKLSWNRQNIRRPGAIILLLGGLALVGCVPSLNPGQTGFYRIHWVPAHTFARVELKDGVLRMAMVNVDWLAKKLEQDPGCLPHRRRGDDDLVLTASTEELQRFVQEHRTELFGDTMELRRMRTGH